VEQKEFRVARFPPSAHVMAQAAEVVVVRSAGFHGAGLSQKTRIMK
jgi:hypothetical protein